MVVVSWCPCQLLLPNLSMLPLFNHWPPVVVAVVLLVVVVVVMGGMVMVVVVMVARAVVQN